VGWLSLHGLAGNLHCHSWKRALVGTVEPNSPPEGPKVRGAIGYANPTFVVIENFRFAILWHEIIRPTGSSATEIIHPRSQHAEPSPITPSRSTSPALWAVLSCDFADTSRRLRLFHQVSSSGVWALASWQRERLAKFKLSLREEKTRLIKFGRLPALGTENGASGRPRR
jgi:hypothetical protein